MKFGHLIKYNMRNIFLRISYTKWGGKAILFFSNFALYSLGCPRKVVLKNYSECF